MTHPVYARPITVKWHIVLSTIVEISPYVPDSFNFKRRGPNHYPLVIHASGACPAIGVISTDLIQTARLNLSLASSTDL
jgi:hypothetical protein